MPDPTNATSPTPSTSSATSTSSTARSSTASSPTAPPRRPSATPTSRRGAGARGPGHRAAGRRQDAGGEDPGAARAPATIPAAEKLRAKFPPGLVDDHAPARPRAQARAAALRRAGHRLARCAARGGGGRAAARRAGLRAASSRRAVLAALDGRRRRASRRRAIAARTGAGRSARRSSTALRAHPAARPRRAGRLGAAAGRQRQGPRHHRHRRRPDGARSSAFAELDVDRVVLVARRATARAGAHAHRHDGRPARRRAGPVRQPAAALHRLARRTTWRCARRRCGGACTCQRVRHARRRDRRDARAARPRRRSTSVLGLAYDRAGAAREPRRAGGAADGGSRRSIDARTDLSGDLHCHTIASDGREHDRGDGAGGARARLRVPRDHRPLGDARLRQRRLRPTQLRAPDRAGRASSTRALDGIELLVGSEVNILPDGSLDYDDELLARARLGDRPASTRRSACASGEMTERIVAAIEHPWIDAIGHLTGRKIERARPTRSTSTRCSRPPRAPARCSRSTPAPTAATSTTSTRARPRRRACGSSIDSDAHRVDDARRHALGHRHRAPRLADEGRRRQHAALERVRAAAQAARRQPSRRGRSSLGAPRGRPRRGGRAPARRARASA